MATLTVAAFIFMLSFPQAFNFQVPIRKWHNRELHEFRVPRASLLRRYLNQSVDPCDDFYEFACGNWAKSHPVSEEKPTASPTETLKELVYLELQQLLQEPVTRDDTFAGRRVKDFYFSCMDAQNASHLRRPTFQNFVKIYGGMPAIDSRWSEHNYNWIMQLSNLRMKFGMDMIIGLNVKPDIHPQRSNRICISDPSIMLPKQQCRQGELTDDKVKELQRQVVDNMAYWFDMREGDAKRLATELFDFEITLCRGMLPDGEDPDFQANIPRILLKELNNNFPTIDFNYFVSTSFGQPIPQPVYLENEPYFVNLAKVMRTTPKRVVANYIMYRALLTMTFPDERNPQKRSRLCIDKSVLHFPKVVGDIYARKFYRSEIADDVDQMWSKLRETFKVDINSQLWIEETTRRLAIYKATGMQLKFPVYSVDELNTEYSSIKINKVHFWENIQHLLEHEQRRQVAKIYYDASGRSWGPEVEAADIKVGYSPVQNIIRIPWGLLQSPVYHRTAPTAYKYGTLGFFIAHQLVHGFDEEGWNYDEKAALRFWWDHNSTVLFKEQVQCFQDQYESYMGRNPTVSGPEMKSFLRELVADNSAVNISFHAYLMWLQKTMEPVLLFDETLSDVDYTNTQLFFITFAQNLCTAKYTETPPSGLLPWDTPNRLEKFRVNGPLSNMREFSREFNCPPGSQMNPADKCIIY